VGVSNILFLVDFETELFAKTLIGRTDVKDALQRLDTLTKEETVMMVASNREAIDDVEKLIRDNVKKSQDGAGYPLTFIHGLIFLASHVQTSNGPGDTSVTHLCFCR